MSTNLEQAHDELESAKTHLATAMRLLGPSSPVRVGLVIALQVLATALLELRQPDPLPLVSLGQGDYRRTIRAERFGGDTEVEGRRD